MYIACTIHAARFFPFTVLPLILRLNFHEGLNCSEQGILLNTIHGLKVEPGSGKAIYVQEEIK